MKTLIAMTVGALPLLFPGAAVAQFGNMMQGGNWGGWTAGYDGMSGYAGVWIPVLLVIAFVVLFALVITQKHK